MSSVTAAKADAQLRKDLREGFIGIEIRAYVTPVETGPARRGIRLTLITVRILLKDLRLAFPSNDSPELQRLPGARQRFL